MFYKLLIGLLTGLSFSTFTFAQQKKVEKATITTTIYCSHCEACETCGLQFKKELYKIPGLKMYQLDPSQNTITVYYSTKKTDLKGIQKAITLLGYDADDMKADPTAYAQLDDCCKQK